MQHIAAIFFTLVLNTAENVTVAIPGILAVHWPQHQIAILLAKGMLRKFAEVDGV